MKPLVYSLFPFLLLLRQSSGVVKLILDTDMVRIALHYNYLHFVSFNTIISMIQQDFDVDDVGALCAAHGLVQLGEAEILAVGLYSDMYVFYIIVSRLLFFMCKYIYLGRCMRAYSMYKVSSNLPSLEDCPGLVM